MKYPKHWFLESLRVKLTGLGRTRKIKSLPNQTYFPGLEPAPKPKRRRPTKKKVEE